MPQMGVSVAEGTVVEWKKRVGDWVEADETIVEISTDKVETEIPSPASGRVSEILVDVGSTVDVGVVLARIDTAARPGEAHSDESTVDSRQSTIGAEHPPPISPVVRRIAAEHGVDLSKLEGTGRRGRVTKKDVLAYLENGQAKPAEATLHIESPYREEPEQGLSTGAGEPLSLMRKQIGDHMRRSLDTAAHCTTIVEADMSRIEEARERMSYLPFVARAAIAALREFPMLNATLEGDRLTVHEEVHLGIAVSLGEEGLIVPVVHNAHELSHEGLAARIKDLASRARSKELRPEEVQGGTFTITNPGAFGALLATPIINQPQVAILDLEAVVTRPVVVGGDSIAIRPMTYLCMSWDHRALDGALAAQFLTSVRRHIEEWNG
jgi:pyruvate/2-oxoglutarate dehydrogenase complex dihydrolipoamide acyltransferase (E2) component